MFGVDRWRAGKGKGACGALHCAHSTSLRAPAEMTVFAVRGEMAGLMEFIGVYHRGMQLHVRLSRPGPLFRHAKGALDSFASPAWLRHLRLSLFQLDQECRIPS